MRKNRSNNGYIGKDRSTPYDGSMAPSNFYFDKSDEKSISGLDYYNTPTSGGGYGATAYVGLTNGELLGAYITDYLSGGTGYVANTNRFMVSGGGGPTAYGHVSEVTNATVNNLILFRRINSLETVDRGGELIFNPNPTFSSGLYSSSITASISGTTLDVTAVSSGTVWPGSLLSGTGVGSNTTITGLGTGRGGTGTYSINNSHTLTSRSMTTSTTATATVTYVNNILSGISLTYPGLYASIPSISWAPTIVGDILPIVIPKLETFTGYSSNPTVTFLNPSSGSGSTASGATASALVVYQINNIGISAGGQNYSSNPTVSVQGAEFTLTETPTISGGTVSAIEVTSSIDQVGFASSPSITIGGWKDLPSVTAGEDKFVGTYAIYDRDNYVAFIAGRTYNVDWGDGTTGIFNSGATASKIYSSSVFAGITQNPIDGYKTLTIQITPVDGGRLTTLNFNVRHPSLISNSSLSSQWLNMKMAGNTLSSLTVSSTTRNIQHRMLESFEFVGSPGNITSLSGLFADCTAFSRYEGKDLTKNCTNLSNMFSGSVTLKQVSELDTSKCTNMTSMFQNCRVLETAPIMNTSALVTATSLFSGCRSLKKIPLYDLRNVTDAGSMFLDCFSLTSIPCFNLSKNGTFTSMFSGCGSLKSVPNIQTRLGSNFNSMFLNCSSLRTVPKFDFRGASSFNSTFSGCRSLIYVPRFDTKRCTEFTSMFQDCVSLTEAPALDTSSATITNSMYNGCQSLIKVPVMDLREVTTASSMFINCRSLASVPRMNMPEVSNISSMFSGCTSLRYVGNLYVPKCTSFSSLFNGCSNLEYPPEIITKGYQRTASSAFDFMFTSCSSLKRLPLFNLALQTIGTNVFFSSAFSSTSRISEIPEYDFIGATGSSNTVALGNMFDNMNNLSRIRARNFCQSFSLPNPNMMGATALNELYTNLAVVGASGANAKTLTVTGSLGTASDNISIATSKGWAVTG